MDASYDSTVCNIVADFILHLSLEFGSEEDHLIAATRVPNDLLNEAFASANRIVIDLGGRGEELHGVFP